MLFVYLGLTGCSWLQTSSSESDNNLPLLNPIGPTRRVVQSINAQWQGRQDNLLCVLELDRKRIALAGLSPQGMSLFNLTYDGQHVKMTLSPLLPAKLPPEMIVKDLQLAYWPAPMLQKQLPQSWRITAVNNSRQLYFNNQLAAEVTFLEPDSVWPKKVELINHRYHYKLLINTVSYEVIPE